MLLAVAELKPHWELVGSDIDVRCVRLTALNLALRNLYGYVIWGDSLKNEKRLIYRTGFNLRGFVREVPLDACPPPVQSTAEEPPVVASSNASEDDSAVRSADDRPPARNQLRLF